MEEEEEEEEEEELVVVVVVEEEEEQGHSFSNTMYILYIFLNGKWSFTYVYLFSSASSPSNFISHPAFVEMWTEIFNLLYSHTFVFLFSGCSDGEKMSLKLKLRSSSRVRMRTTDKKNRHDNDGVSGSRGVVHIIQYKVHSAFIKET